jgi:XTP/dITP diphosphohydrolase
MKKIVAATQNRNKFSEFQKELSDLPLEIIPAFNFPGIPEIEEDGKTLEENSYKKASLISKFTHLAALADDTGLFVDALGGQPGIYAARFAGEKCSYLDNVNKMLSLLNGIPIPQRTATFRTVITIFVPGRPIKIARGEIAGFITREIRGNGGFGYDPIFQPLGTSRVFAEMTMEEKNAISHRGLALQKAKEILSEFIGRE